MLTGAPVNVLDYGAIGDGTTDNAVAFQLAFDAVADNGKSIYIPAGTYKINSVLSTNGHLNMFGDGDKSILDFNGTVTGGFNAISVAGSLTAIPNLSVSVSKDAQSLSFATAPSLTAGDVIVIYNPTNFSYSNFRPVYRAGEWCEIVSLSGTTATISNALYDGYVNTAVDIYKLNSKTVSLRNFKIVGTTIASLIVVSLCKNPLVENITGYLENNSIVSFDRCYNAKAINLNLFNKGNGNDDYALVITNSQDVEVIGGSFYARRHAITTGGAGDIGSVPCRNLRFSELTTKNDINSGVWSADFHGNTEDSVYENCRIYNGASWQGKNNRYVNCVISDIFTYQCIYSAEIKGGYFTLENCTLLVSGNPQLNGRGIVDIGGQNDAVTNGTVETTTFIIKNCRVIAPQSSSLTSFAVFRNAGTVQSVNFEVDGITALSTPSFGQVLLTSKDSGTASSQFIIVDNISNFPSGTILHSPNANSYLNFPHRCQKQSGRVTLTATSGTNNTISSAINYKYVYPRIAATLTTSGGASTQTFIGNKIAIANIYQTDASYIRPQISTGDSVNWSATLPVSVSWSAFIDEV
jgi:hypothetical protein